MIRRVSVREGYDLWGDTYEASPNPVVTVDARHTIAVLRPSIGERILDAGCGTGRNLRTLAALGASVIGIDFSAGMLRSARGLPVAQADLQRAFPFRAGTFDAVLCALIGEHLTELRICLGEMHSVLRPGGRLVFSVYHPDLAAAGKEANFELNGIEYRLGAERYTTEDYAQMMRSCGFADVRYTEFQGDGTALAGRNALLVIEAVKS